MLFCSPFDENHPRYYRITNTLQQENFYALEVGYNRVPPNLCQHYVRNKFILHYITSGDGFFCGHRFDKDYGYIILPEEQEDLLSNKFSTFESYWIMFQGSDAMSIIKKASLPIHNNVFRFDLNEKCAEIIHKVLFDIKPKNEIEESFLMQSALYEIFSLHMSVSTNIPKANIQPALQIKKILDNNFYREININEISKMLQYNRATMFKEFKAEYNDTPLQYLTKLRISKSKELLTNKLNDLTISEISHIVGFNDPLYFSRIFKKHTGISPNEFKKKYC